MNHFGARSLPILPGRAGSDREDAPDPGPAARQEEQEMDDVVNRFAKELADAIAAAVADNPQVEACRARAREAGFDMRVTLEAVVGFVNRTNGGPVTKITTPSRLLAPKRQFDLSANDRRFLRSLRIAGDEAKEAVE
jgi:hypothetical protein